MPATSSRGRAADSPAGGDRRGRGTGSHGGGGLSHPSATRPRRTAGALPCAALPACHRMRGPFVACSEAVADSFPRAMDINDTKKEALFSPGCEPVVEDEERRRLLWLMAEYFRTIGYTDIKARLPGFMPPPVLSGTIEDHRPDFTCRQSDSARTPIILEVVTPDMVEDPHNGEPLEPAGQRRQALQRGAALRGAPSGRQRRRGPGAQAAGSLGWSSRSTGSGLSEALSRPWIAGRDAAL